MGCDWVGLSIFFQFGVIGEIKRSENNHRSLILHLIKFKQGRNDLTTANNHQEKNEGTLVGESITVSNGINWHICFHGKTKNFKERRSVNTRKRGISVMGTTRMEISIGFLFQQIM
ncbi:hypothetical protein L6452_11081 [Arctium lappa]|uniref:Uncharacterized protein n=1 Tax=Arctium lappa TaxID=4217 RepID=A0ACB9DNA6_ARCLA|nr:hypothetical protein L6452_11081 [Arctium lappa]